jgi:3'-5' exoribonuclease
MKDFFIADAARFENQPVTSYFLIASISARDRKPGGGGSSANAQYLALTLADKSGQFEARMWEDFADVLATCSAGCYVKAQGQISKYQGKFQITLSKLRLAAAVEIDTADFVPTTQFDIPTMAAELRGYVAAFRNPHLRRLVLSFLDDPTLGPQFIEAPAAKRLHHAWLGGLLEHVLCLVRVCLATAPFYPEVDPDLLVTGAILHDIGKVRELSWGSSFDYTLEGQLIGHISIAQGLLHEKIALLDAEAAAAERTQTPGGPFIAPASGAMSGVQDATGLQPAESDSSQDGALAPDGTTVLPSGGMHDAAPTPTNDVSSRPESALLAFAPGGVRESDAAYALAPGRSSGLQPAEPDSSQDGALAPAAAPAESAAEEGASAPGPFPPKLRLLVEHMILSHHGKLEFGSPKLPMTPEAMLLSALDDLEAKFQTLRNEFAAAKASGRPATEPTEWVRSMERPLFNSQAWLAKDSE